MFDCEKLTEFLECIWSEGPKIIYYNPVKNLKFTDAELHFNLELLADPSIINKNLFNKYEKGNV